MIFSLLHSLRNSFVPKAVALCAFSLCVFSVNGQFKYISPSHFHGLFNGHLTSARAQGMGYTTVTTEGIATSFYNPAAISPGNTRLDVSVNYAKGHPYHPDSYYSFAGAAFRPLPRLTIGASRFSWIDPKPYWTAQIGGTNFDTDRSELHAYSLLAAYRLLEGLHIGVSANMIRQLAIEDTVTLRESIFNAGLIYDRPVNLIKHDKIENQTVRFAVSLANALMNAKVEQRHKDNLNYRDMPIIARAGAAYSFSIPMSAAFTAGKKFFAESPEILDLSVRLQYQNFLKHKDHIFNDHKYSTAVGVGAEAWFMKLLSLRMGYYGESRSDSGSPGDIVVTNARKHGFTWGFGANIPLQRLTDGKVPVDVEANFVTSRMMNELDNRYENNIPSVFGDKRFLFCAGLNIRWNKTE